MNRNFIVVTTLLFGTLLSYFASPKLSEGSEVSSITSFYDLNAEDINGQPVSLSQYKGKVVLVVNTASKCGFTPQFKGLEELYQINKAKDFVVLAFPSNDFLSQEPGSNEEVKAFCTGQYGVTFPLFSKNPVTGSQKQPVYKFLTELSGEEYTGEIKWNFEKFLIDRNGQVRARFGSFTAPLSTRLVQKVDELLAESSK